MGQSVNCDTIDIPIARQNEKQLSKYAAFQEYGDAIARTYMAISMDLKCASVWSLQHYARNLLPQVI